MAEMLIQSHLNDIHLLAALPDAWKEGKVTGLRARGGFEVGIQWKSHRLTTATVKSLNGEPCNIRTSQPLAVNGKKANSRATEIGFVTEFSTKKGQTYTLSAL